MTRRQFIAVSFTIPVIAIALTAALEWPAAGRARADRRSDVIAKESSPTPVSEKYTLVASVPNPAFRPGDPIPLTSEFRNRTRSPVTIYKCGFWPNHRVIVTDRDGVELPMTEEGERCLAVYKWGGRDRNIKVIVEGGGSNEETVDIAGLYHYRPGRYRLEVVFDENLAEPVPLKVESSPIEFEIE